MLIALAVTIQSAMVKHKVLIIAKKITVMATRFKFVRNLDEPLEAN